MAERLCMFQQTIQTYESGNRRI
ncbi:hypothetical protein [Pseudomonas vlassakiae]